MKRFASLLTLAFMMIFVTACSNSGSSSGSTGGGGGSGWQPNKRIEFVAPATPGGGWDTTARAMKKVLSDQNLIKKPLTVANKPGGSGEVGWKYLKQKGPNTLAINSSLLITNHLLGRSDLTYKNFTPLAILATEWEAIVVPKDSDISSLEGLMKQLKSDPKSKKIAVAPGLGNDDHLSFLKAAKAYGVGAKKLDFLVYESGGDVTNALLGHHVGAATMSVSEAKQQYKAGKLKILAVSSEERIDGLEDIPTYQESGVDIVFPHWRGIMGPPDMTEEQIAYWDKKIGKMVKTDAWKKVLKNNEWQEFYKDSSESKQFFKKQVKQYKDLIETAGLSDKY